MAIIICDSSFCTSKKCIKRKETRQEKRATHKNISLQKPLLPRQCQNNQSDLSKNKVMDQNAIHSIGQNVCRQLQVRSSCSKQYYLNVSSLLPHSFLNLSFFNVELVDRQALNKLAAAFLFSTEQVIY